MTDHHISRSARKMLRFSPSRLIAEARVGALKDKRVLPPAGDGDDEVRNNRVLTFLAALLMALAPHQIAVAQEEAAEDARNVGVTDRRQPEYDPLGLRFGAFHLNASVELGAEHSNNLFAEESGDEDEDTYFNVRPYVSLASTWSRHSLYVTAGGSFSQYQDFSSENAESANIAAGGRLDIGRSTAVGGDLRVAREIESRTDPDSVLTVEPVEYDVNAVSGYVTHAFNRVRVRLSASETQYDYQDAGAPGSIGFEQDYRDRTDSNLTARVEYAFTPRLSVLAQVASEDREYDVADVSPSSEGTTYLGGVAFEFTNLLRGEFTAGQFERDYTPTAAVPNVGTVKGPAVSGRLHWFATPLTTVSFQASRDAQESSYENPFVNTIYAGRVDHELLRNVILTAGASVATREFEGLDRNDDVLIYDVGARYLMNRRISFSASYVRNETESEGLASYRTFDEDHVRLAMRWAL